MCFMQKFTILTNRGRWHALLWEKNENDVRNKHCLLFQSNYNTEVFQLLTVKRTVKNGLDFCNHLYIFSFENKNRCYAEQKPQLFTYIAYFSHIIKSMVTEIVVLPNIYFCVSQMITELSFAKRAIKAKKLIFLFDTKLI